MRECAGVLRSHGLFCDALEGKQVFGALATSAPQASFCLVGKQITCTTAGPDEGELDF